MYPCVQHNPIILLSKTDLDAAVNAILVSNWLSLNDWNFCKDWKFDAATIVACDASIASSVFTNVARSSVYRSKVSKMYDVYNCNLFTYVISIIVNTVYTC